MKLARGAFHTPWLFLLYFLYIFNISFAPLPYFLRTRILLGVVGLAVATLMLHPLRISKSAVTILGVFGLLLVPSALTMIVNRTVDLWFVQYAAQQVLHLFAAYLLVLLSVRLIHNFGIGKLFAMLVYAVALNNLFALVMFFVPPLQDFMIAVQNYDELAQTKLEEYLDMAFRFYGWGIQTFFMGGLLSGYALILLAYLLRKEQRGWRGFWLVLLFLFITITGLFIARTTLVGALIGGVYLFWPERLNPVVSLAALRRNVIFVSVIVGALVLGIALLNYVFPDAWNSDVIRYALELYINLDQGDELATQSTDHLLTMYLWPDNWRTWLVGDGIFNVPDGFYMDTDVGYLRMIYYFGLVGMVTFFVIQFFLAWRIHWLYRDRHVAFLLLVSLGYVLLLNLKALADVNVFLFLVFWLGVLQQEAEPAA